MLTTHHFKITRKDRQKLLKQKSFLIWLTGLSGSGKSTLANALQHKLHKQGFLTYVLDGDNIRQGINSNLGFSAADRSENIRRIAEVAKLFVDAGVIVLVSAISPFRADRAQARNKLAKGEFVEVYVKCDLAECERRDVKQLYAKARSGEIAEFTGISSPYEEPLKPEIVAETDKYPEAEVLEWVYTELENKGYLKKK